MRFAEWFAVTPGLEQHIASPLYRAGRRAPQRAGRRLPRNTRRPLPDHGPLRRREQIVLDALGSRRVWTTISALSARHPKVKAYSPSAVAAACRRLQRAGWIDRQERWVTDRDPSPRPEWLYLDPDHATGRVGDDLRRADAR